MDTENIVVTVLNGTLMDLYKAQLEIIKHPTMDAGDKLAEILELEQAREGVYKLIRKWQ